MLIGVDSYSFHRLLGDLRAGEDDPGERLADGGLAVIAEARPLGVDVLALETCYLPAAVDVGSLARAAAPLGLFLSWGAPNGLCFGASDAALADLLGWVDRAAGAGVQLMRIVVAGPALRGAEPVEEQIARTVAPLRSAAARAAARGVSLAVENHGDLTAAQLADLLERVGDDAVGVCVDTANLLRVGDDVVEGVRLLAGRTLMVHLKDVEPLDGVIDPVAGPASVAYGTGVVPLDETLAELQAAGFAGPVCIEVAQLAPGADERDLLRDGIAWLRERLY